LDVVKAAQVLQKSFDHFAVSGAGCAGSDGLGQACFDVPGARRFDEDNQLVAAHGRLRSHAARKRPA
jgi:hypothetical protein